MPSHHVHRISDVENWYPEGAGMDFRVIQISAGRLDFVSNVTDLSGVAIQINRSGSDLLARECYRGGDLLMGFILELEGREASPTAGVIDR